MPTGSVPCRSCGTPLLADSLICPSCGAPADGLAAVTDAAQGPPTEAVDGEAGSRSGASAPVVPASAIAGSYLSPSAVHQAHFANPPAPAVMPLAGTPEPSRGAAVPDALPGATPRATSPAARPPRPGDAPLFADLPFDAPNSLAGWLVAIGSGVGALSFLLPWAPGIVNYTSSWGLSSLANLPILAMLIATAVLAILPNAVAPWLRSGVLGLIGGSLFLGLLWPYVLGDFGAAFGSIAGAAASIALIVGGILGVAPQREGPPAT